MAENKTIATKASVKDFLHTVQDAEKRADCMTLLRMMQQITGKKPVMWGPSIVGFDTYHYVYDSGRSGDMPITGFSPRKQNLTIYIMPGFKEYSTLLKKLGKHSTGKSCLYIKRLSDIDPEILERIIRSSVTYMRQKYHAG